MADHRGSGLAIALTSSASFALSGMFASALLASGWSSGAITTLRILGAAAVLIGPAFFALRGNLAVLSRARWQLLGFGIFAVTLAQLGFFTAVQFIPPALALLIEYLGPVLLVGWTTVRTRKAPTRLTLVGVVVALVGLVLVSGVIGSVHLNPLGILFGLFAALGNAVYWALSASETHGLPPVTLAGFGLGIGGVLLGATAAVGLLPFRMNAGAATLAGRGWSAPIMIIALILLATVLPYVSGIIGTRRLGATVASFVGYGEPIFAFVWMGLLLSLVPTAMQFAGAAAIIAGVVLVRLGEIRVLTAKGVETPAELPPQS